MNYINGSSGKSVSHQSLSILPTMSETTPLLARAALRRSTLLWRTGALFAAAGVITGAFGAHGLKSRKGVTQDSIHAWETAAHYAIFNGLGLLAVSLHPRFALNRYAGPAIAAGGLLFSGSIFALVLNRDLKFLGPVTPLGGLVMLSGYVALAL
ncbi:DUF423-domain-containing protein [Marasmius fiardii PR-910]|nr:DUF423-domain-containing protein [Marasmius fiardii PR-910]